MFICSFLLTAEEKEPKKTATPKPPSKGCCKFKIAEADDFSCFFGKPGHGLFSLIAANAAIISNT